VVEQRVILGAWTQRGDDRGKNESYFNSGREIKPGEERMRRSLPVARAEIEFDNCKSHHRNLGASLYSEFGNHRDCENEHGHKTKSVAPIRRPRSPDAKLIKQSGPQNRLNGPAEEKNEIGPIRDDPKMS